MKKLIAIIVVLTMGNLARAAEENFNIENIEYVESCRKMMLHPDKIEPYYFGGVSMSIRIMLYNGTHQESYTIYYGIDAKGENVIIIRRREVDQKGEVKIKEYSPNLENKHLKKIALFDISSLQSAPTVDKANRREEDVLNYMILVDSPFTPNGKRIYRSDDERYVLEACVKETVQALKDIFKEMK